MEVEILRRISSVRLRMTPSDYAPINEGGCSHGRECGQKQLALADEVAAAFGAHDGGVNGIGRNVEAFSGAIRFRNAVHGEGHFPSRDDVRRFHPVGVVGITRVGPVFPDKDVSEAFTLELGDESVLTHGGIVAR